ncbi:hypothetical protein MASSI9I_20721 [Massilia sp. 9I]|nr:hypothetical protein MASSI9I_20721 [Massilia sp. 9I]
MRRPAGRRRQPPRRGGRDRPGPAGRPAARHPRSAPADLPVEDNVDIVQADGHLDGRETTLVRRAARAWFGQDRAEDSFSTAALTT